MSSAPMSPLRQRMIEDMAIRQFGQKTQHDYVRVVADFARFQGRSPDRAEPEDLRRYQLHLATQGASPGKMNLAVSALRFFCKVTLDRPGFGERLATVRTGERLPVVLSPEEVALLLHCAPGLKHKAALSVVFTLPAPLAAIAFHNQAVVYDLLFKAAAETLQTIAADPRHLGARIGLVAVLHTWGSALTHHPHIHCIVPGGGLSPDSKRWVACRPGFFLPVRVLSRLFRRLFLEKLLATHAQGWLAFFDDLAPLAEPDTFAAHLAPPRRTAIANSRLVSLDEHAVRFRWKDYRTADPATGAAKLKTMSLTPDEFLRRFLLHILPPAFHRIRHYGLLAKGPRAIDLDWLRALIAEQAADQPTAPADDEREPIEPETTTLPACPCCGGRMRIIERFGCGRSPCTAAGLPLGFDTS